MSVSEFPGQLVWNRGGHRSNWSDSRSPRLGRDATHARPIRPRRASERRTLRPTPGSDAGVLHAPSPRLPLSDHSPRGPGRSTHQRHRRRRTGVQPKHRHPVADPLRPARPGRTPGRSPIRPPAGLFPPANGSKSSPSPPNTPPSMTARPPAGPSTTWPGNWSTGMPTRPCAARRSNGPSTPPT